MPRPFQNRVDPWGNLQAYPGRAATRMGNRGILHNEKQEIVRASRTKAWLCCRLKLDDVKREIFQFRPKFSYSELFFLDEATALSAGHRPCKDCQPLRFQKFKEYWCTANTESKSSSKVLISEVDRQLESERSDTSHRKITFKAKLSELPGGTMFTEKKKACLVTLGGLYDWSFDGYKQVEYGKDREVEVLTPRSIVAAMKEGYMPAIHLSADA